MLRGDEQSSRITWGEEAPRVSPAWDVQMEVMELPYLFRTTCADFRLATNYLAPPASEIERVKEVMGCTPCDACRTGVGGRGMESVPLASRSIVLRPLVEVEGCEFWSLQGGRRRQWNEFARSMSNREPACTRQAAGCGRVRLWDSHAGGRDRAARSRHHGRHSGCAPGGAMGVPAWVMLQHAGRLALDDRPR